MSRPGAVAKQFVRQVVASITERDGGKRVRRRPPQTLTRGLDRGVRIEYTPELDGDPDPGEVVWTWVPYEDDPSMGKDRPVVVIGRTGDVLTGIALTTKAGRHDDDLVDIGSGAWDPRARTSYAKVERLIAVDAAAVRREGAILNRRVFDQVIEAVSRRHEIVRA